ncbi:MAG TPA: heat-inducible transcriptional repressor HrcA [Blastocatellia bacterium]|nr:heat-inducible transcriptional repressor HrcA [Blastocatellia bacterium]
MLRSRQLPFDPRKREILGAIVKTHIATGEPVGSLVLTRQSKEGLSSATIRNICAELESEGFLSHPHTSAGRMPTDKGYRYYVDNLIGARRLSRSDVARIDELLVRDQLDSPQLLMEKTSRLLSELSDNVGIVVSPSISQELLHHIEFVSLSDQRILVITVSTAGRVQNRVIRANAEFAQDELNSTSKYLVENFHGWTLAAIREEMLRRMTEEKALYDKLLQNAVLLCSQSLRDGDQPDVFIEGASTILGKPDFADTELMRALFKMFEQKSRIVRLLSECLEGDSTELVAVRIGSENEAADLRSCTIIASRCFYHDGSAMGGIGVVGPTRIEYDRLIRVVEYTARLCERALGAAGGQPDIFTQANG